MEDQKKYVVVEVCQNCSTHKWNTRHNESKYQSFYAKVQTAIATLTPDVEVLCNKVPKSYAGFDLYYNLVHNNASDNKCFDQIPRIGAFEVSYKGQLVFSKLLGSKWPNVSLIAGRVEKIVEAMRRGIDHTAYLANALQDNPQAKVDTRPATAT